MHVPATAFKAYDVRGVAPDVLTVEPRHGIYTRIGQALTADGRLRRCGLIGRPFSRP
jgi:hypothetical protein